MKKIEQKTMTDKEALQEYKDIADIHTKRINAAFSYLKNTVPFLLCQGYEEQVLLCVKLRRTGL